MTEQTEKRDAGRARQAASRQPELVRKPKVTPESRLTDAMVRCASAWGRSDFTGWVRESRAFHRLALKLLREAKPVSRQSPKKGKRGTS